MPAWWRGLGVVAVAVVGVMLGGCARPGRELKAPCAPLAYAGKASCGPLKPVNAPPFDRVVEDG
ncbi:hypothetical protein [Mesorhizobium sp. M00.F.Ca.ET.217.01.1.1]|uniref:hypothetical protein n=1 Tax=Mesorhizobium sp. M00.F.Ca.ET.217.01.1.1 TaxID=2500529 RepID=UPI000FDC262D|nr:hypothetical protein [Mesorhizobium sp. M00.F.Ca.ET.217.01.1.1]TGQ13493.1 hypothetical protein EN860_030015 [Mesorhizobium sp. M00.F.Ca.ET.217.01.1.1]TGV85358.1 hypothetical protein EN801_028725 [Mesorhizobium sp. M00.F.Ca.ET.158.01.1.1]TIU76524.1 MAG: hypothetical protein E5W06_31200 [Mesorhizobium sp.]